MHGAGLGIHLPALKALSVRPGLQLEFDQHISGLRLQTAHYVAAAHYPKGQVAGTTTVRFADSWAHEVVLPSRIGLTEYSERLRIEPIGTDLALDRVRLATLTHHEVNFPT